MTKGRKATSVAGSPGLFGAGDGSFVSPRGQESQGASPPISSRKLSFRSLLGRGNSATSKVGRAGVGVGWRRRVGWSVALG